METQQRRQQRDLAVTEQVTLVASAAAPAQARAFVNPLLERFGAQGCADVIALVLSELVSNAFHHGVGPIDLAVTGEADAFQIEVTTAAGPTEPHIVERGIAEPTGRGLKIVQSLSESWGHAADGAGNLTVWARIGLDGARGGGRS